MTGLYRAFEETDSSLIEINPFITCTDGRLFALDAKMNFDDNALERHKELEPLRDLDEEDPSETEAAKYALFREGFLASTSVPIRMYFRTRPGLETPDATLAEFDQTGRIKWATDLAEIPAKFGVNNVYGEIGTSFATCAVSSPALAARPKYARRSALLADRSPETPLSCARDEDQ